MVFFIYVGRAFSSNAEVDVEKVIVRGTIDPAKKELRTVSQLYLKVLTENPKELKFFLNPGRNVIKILGPEGEQLQYRISMRRFVGYVMVFKQVDIQLPSKLQARDSLKLTFFLDGKVKDQGIFKIGNFINEKGLAVMGNVLYPDLGAIEEGKESFLWLELELTSPSGWTLATGGVPEIAEIEESNQIPSRTGLTGEQVENFLNEKTTGKRTLYYWEKIGVNTGEFYLYGGPNWSVQTREVSGVRVHLYSIRTDSASASVLLDEAEKTIPFLEEEIGPFPLKDVSIVVAPQMLFGKTAGAMESWGMVTLRSRSLEWIKQWPGQALPHEMIHLYWNGSLRTPSEEALSLSEPFAVYLNKESWNDPSASQQSRINDCDNYWWDAQLVREQPLVGLNELDPFFFAGFYDKGPLVASMLADLLGKEKFRQFQQEVFAEGDGKIYNLDSLQAGIERYSIYPCKNLINDLFRSKTLYDYAVCKVKVTKAGSDSCTVDIHISKKKTGEFPMLLRVSFADSVVVEQRIDSKSKEQTLQLKGPAPFKEVELDPDVRTLDCNRFNNVYPRRNRFLLAWGRGTYHQFPHPIMDWGDISLSSRRLIFSPVLDYTDFDGIRLGMGIEARRAYQNKKYLWTAWTNKQEKLRVGAGWLFSPKPLERLKLVAHYHDDGLVREAIFTTFVPTQGNWLAFSLGAGYEERPSEVISIEKLEYSQAAPSFRLGLTIPYLDYGSRLLFPFPGGRSYMLLLHFRKSASIWGGKMDYLQIEGDTRIGFYPLGFRLRWGLSGGVDSEGEGFPLGGRWGYADDRVRMVRGYNLRFAKSFLLLNTEWGLVSIPNGSVRLFGDLARYRETEGAESKTLFGYGIGIRFWLPGTDWLESVPIRIEYGAPKDGIDKGFFYIGTWWGI